MVPGILWIGRYRAEYKRAANLMSFHLMRAKASGYNTNGFDGLSSEATVKKSELKSNTSDLSEDRAKIVVEQQVLVLH